MEAIYRPPTWLCGICNEADMTLEMISWQKSASTRGCRKQAKLPSNFHVATSLFRDDGMKLSSQRVPSGLVSVTMSSKPAMVNYYPIIPQLLSTRCYPACCLRRSDRQIYDEAALRTV